MLLRKKEEKKPTSVRKIYWNHYSQESEGELALKGLKVRPLEDHKTSLGDIGYVRKKKDFCVASSGRVVTQAESWESRYLREV